jgi:hypothetical protein
MDVVCIGCVKSFIQVNARKRTQCGRHCWKFGLCRSARPCYHSVHALPVRALCAPSPLHSFVRPVDLTSLLDSLSLPLLSLHITLVDLALFCFKASLDGR